MQSGVLLSLDDPLENIQLQKAQQNLKSPANTQRSKGQLREFDENKMSQPVTLSWLKSAPPIITGPLAIRLPFV